MQRKILQIGYEPERDRLTWAGWDIHCGHALKSFFQIVSVAGHGRLYPSEYNGDGWYMPGQPGVSPVGLWARERAEG